ncbi:MAG: helix-turn-helix transcriptional regulator [Selenomonadaceae bacterium]|nr:helix-turn-helix transcriptional regulator [Selenomonadaceae bacterium]
MKEDFSEEMRCIGMRIAGFRRLRNMTQEELAFKLNMNKSYLSQIESASSGKNISLPMLIRISRALDVELALLTDIDGIYKSDLKNFWSDMKDTFAEIKKLNDDMDKMLEQFERADKIFSNGGASKVKE